MSSDQKITLATSASEQTTTEKDRSVRRILFIEGLTNLVVLIAKSIVGIASGSSAILGDALHSLADVANNIVALVVSKISASPPDLDHPYGHRKFETLAVFILATLLSVMAVEISIRAIDRAGQPIQHTDWGLGVMIGVLILNISLATWENHWAHRLESNLLRADARHTFGDVFTTIAVIVGWELASHGYPILDTVFTLLVSALVFYLAFDLYRRVIPVLVDKAGIAPELIEKTIRTIPGVLDVRQVRSRLVESEIIADVIILVESEMSTEKSHQIANEIEAALSSKYSINDVTVHIEPNNSAQSLEKDWPNHD